MLKTPCLRLALALFIGIPAATAQIGDSQDRKGVVQKSLVPPEKIPPAPALSPEEALKSFTVAPGFKLEIAAAEPLVQEPVAIAFGPDGRMWVAEMRGYMPDLDGNGEDAPVGRITVLADHDGDGRYDESKIFMDELVLPRAIALVGDGVLVGAPPELMFLRDTDGDGRADKKDVVATDYGVRVDPKRPHMANPERAPNSLLWAQDNWIYSAAYTRKFRYVDGAWQTGGTIFRGQWGLTQDDLGRFYYGSNSDSLRVDVIFSDYIVRNPHYPRLGGINVNGAEDQLVWPVRVTPGINRGYRPEMLRDGRLKEFTAACGWFVYRGDLLPGLRGNLFVAEPSANFVRRTILREEDGIVRGRNAYAEQQAEFIASTDERFRPVNFATGPDGALYVVDLYRGVLQHRISLTTYLRKQSEDRGLVNPQHLGRIYRVVPANGGAARAVAAPRTGAEWIEQLAHPNAFWRESAQRILVERRDQSLVPAIRQVALEHPNPLARIHALWVLDGMGALGREEVAAALAVEDDALRVNGIRLSERFLGSGERDALVQRLVGLARNGTPQVQLQAVLALGVVDDPKVAVALAEVVRANPKNTHLADALFSGLANEEFTLLEQLLERPAWADDAEASRILSGLVRGVSGSRQQPAIERVIAFAADAVRSGADQRAAALLDGLVPASGSSRRPLQIEREPAGWADLGQNPATRSRVARLKEVIVWPGKPGVKALAEVAPLTAEQQGRFESGRTLYAAVCAACHQADGRGLDGLAPPLLDSEWILGPAERPVRIVLNGVRGNITVLGRMHTGDMPAFGGALNDEQISSILTYLRREWGHAATPVDPDQVKVIRAATSGRNDAWTSSELQRIK